jgi:hypothetical protein
MLRASGLRNDHVASRTRRAAILVAAIAATLVGAAPGIAAAQDDADGIATLRLEGPAHKRLLAAEVKTKALAPGLSAGRNLTLPVDGARFGAAPRVDLGGSVRLRRRAGGRTRTVVLRDTRVELGAKPTLIARVGRERRELARVRLDRPLDKASQSVLVERARVVLTRAGGTLLKRRLALGRRPSGTLGRLRVSASPLTNTPAPGGGTPNPSAPPPSSAELPLLARPATAVDVTSATVNWHVRESFIQYMNAGEGTSVADGAVAGEPTVAPGSDAELVYDFRFPFTSGWFDPAGGSAAVYFRGVVNFSYSAHTIDLDAASPELELNGTASRAIMRLRNAGTGLESRREVLVDLDLAQATVTVSPDGRTRTYERIPGRIPAGTASSVFAGYYLPGEPFGWFTVTFTVG